MKKNIPQQPKLFLCEECNVYFFSVSKMNKPTHSRCFGHKTRLATKAEIDQINQANKTCFIYNENIEAIKYRRLFK